jgi:spore germination protein GerM
MRKRLIGLTAATAFAVLVAACGLPADDRFEPISAENDRFDLAQTTTPTTSLAPTTTVDAATTSTIASEPVRLYFITGRQLTSVVQALPAEPALGQVMAALLDGPPSGGLGTGLRTTLPVGADINVTSSAGIATVDLPEGIFDSLEPSDQRLVFGQIVLTLTDRPGVGPVVFTLDGQKMRVFRGDASLTEQGESVSRDDYLGLLSTAPTPTTTSVPVSPSADGTPTTGTSEG